MSDTPAEMSTTGTDGASRSNEPSDEKRKLRRRVLVLLALTTLIVVGFWVHPYRAQQASRYALTAAIADQGTIVLDDYVDVIGIDRSVRDGRIYSDKAPGQPFLAVPVYLSYRAVGGQDALVRQIDENLGLWWQTFWFASVPLAALAVLMYTEARRFSTAALAGALALACSTLLLPFGALLFGHVLGALLVYASWIVLNATPSPTPRRLLAVGALIGAAVIVEYTAVLAGVVVAAVALARARGRIVALIAGGLPFAIALAWYNASAFGDPLTLSYSFSAFEETTATARPVLAMFSEFEAGNLFDVFFSFRGFAVATPIVVVALVVALMLSLRPERRVEGTVPLVIFGLYLLIPLFWGNPWGGDSPGARYMVTALPFLAVPTAIAFERLRRPALIAGAVGGFTMLLATVTDPMLERSGNFGVNAWLVMSSDGDFVPNLPEVVLGMPRSMGMVGILAAATLGAAALLRANRTLERREVEMPAQSPVERRSGSDG